MGFDQKGAPVLTVRRNAGGAWDVWELDFEKPLASFDDKQDACDYANDLAKTKKTATVVVDEGAAAGGGKGDKAAKPGSAQPRH
jgi:hypothetical protein